MSNYTVFLENIVLPIGDFLNGSSVIKNLKWWRRVSKLSEAEIAEIEKEKLKLLLEHCVKKVPFYKKYADVKKNDPFEWIKQFPIMDKSNIRENMDLLCYTPKEKLIKKETSGSSGNPGITYMSIKDQDMNRAIQMLWWEWGGWRPGTPIVQTGLTLKRGFLKGLKDLLFKTKYYSAFGLSEDEGVALLKSLKNKKGYYLGGYASSLFVLAELKKKYEVDGVRFDGAISWGDKLFPHYRRSISEAFDCNTTDTYACSEGLMFASQRDLDYYYIMTPHVYLELLDKEGNPVEDGQLGYVVGTRLDAYDMPLVRYYTGDLAVRLPRSKYPVNRLMNFPLLERVIGRDTDIVHTRSGKYMIVHFFTVVFEYEHSIKQFRVIQHNLDSMEIEYIPHPDCTDETIKRIEEKIQTNLNEKFPIKWSKVDFIPATSSGKPQMIKSYLNRGIS